MGRNSINLILICVLCLKIHSQNFPLKLSRADDDNAKFIQDQGKSICESRVKVKDHRPENCTFNNDFYFYPVFTEDFNYKEYLQNNWMFSFDWTKDDHFEANGDGNGNSKGKTWFGDGYDPYNRTNITVQNGTCFLTTIQENTTGIAYNIVGSKSYDFTGAILKSLFRLKQGVFEIRVKLPENPNFWPAFWLNEGDNEIDIYEFFDGEISEFTPCETYHQYKMHIHRRNYGNKHCIRGRKFPVANEPPGSTEDFFYNWHTVKCLWTDYKLEIYLDGTLVGQATKFYDGPYTGSGACLKHGPSGIPKDLRDCNYMSNANGCDVLVGGPFNKCLKWNQVDKDEGWPNTNFPLKLYINNVINFNLPGVNSTLLNSWNNFIPENKQMAIDWVKIYQPFKCNSVQNICNLSDMMQVTGQTNFLTGSDIRIAGGNCSFVNDSVNNDDWKPKPLHFLATNQIEIGPGAEFRSGSFLRAEIVNCSGGFNQYQKGGNSLVTDEEITEVNNLFNTPFQTLDSLNYKSGVSNEFSSKTDNGSIILFPNPTHEKILIDMDEEDFNDIIKLEIIDNLGRKIPVSKSKQISVADLSPGFYELCFYFSHGFIVVKSFVKE